MSAPLQIVLVTPQIPQNTGSIARTCAATNTPLHIVGEIPFEISDRTVRRAGLDYWPHVQLTRHTTWQDCAETLNRPRFWYFSTHATRLYYQADFAPGDVLVFGSETAGLGAQFLSELPAQSLLKIPIPCPGVRSLNLSNAASIALYEARRQLRLDEDDPAETRPK